MRITRLGAEGGLFDGTLSMRLFKLSRPRTRIPVSMHATDICKANTSHRPIDFGTIAAYIVTYKY